MTECFGQLESERMQLIRRVVMRTAESIVQGRPACREIVAKKESQHVGTSFVA